LGGVILEASEEVHLAVLLVAEGSRKLMSLSVASQKIEEKREKKVVRMENIIIVRRKY
jgi:hypothetical protein